MNINFSIEEAVTKRYSVRNYQEKEIETEKLELIKAFIDSLDNPFGSKINFHYLDSKGMKNEEKLGTYGVIKGAKQYIGTTITLEGQALEALGYEFEALVLYLAHLGLGACWLGGTFDRAGFAEAMKVKEGDIFPIITPYGYPADHKHEMEIEMRKMIQADQRKEWSELFFNESFSSPITKEEAKDMAFALEMVRLGPSASNKQPWRIVLKDGNWHFFEYKEPGYSDRFSYDIQRVDMGIAAAHFDFSVKDKNINGHFEISNAPEVELPENVQYSFSWIRD